METIRDVVIRIRVETETSGMRKLSTETQKASTETLALTSRQQDFYRLMKRSARELAGAARALRTMTSDMRSLGTETRRTAREIQGLQGGRSSDFLLRPGRQGKQSFYDQYIAPEVSGSRLRSGEMEDRWGKGTTPAVSGGGRYGGRGYGGGVAGRGLGRFAYAHRGLMSGMIGRAAGNLVGGATGSEFAANIAAGIGGTAGYALAGPIAKGIGRVGGALMTPVGAGIAAGAVGLGIGGLAVGSPGYQYQQTKKFGGGTVERGSSLLLEASDTLVKAFGTLKEGASSAGGMLKSLFIGNLGTSGQDAFKARMLQRQRNVSLAGQRLGLQNQYLTSPADRVRSLNEFQGTLNTEQTILKKERGRTTDPEMLKRLAEEGMELQLKQRQISMDRLRIEAEIAKTKQAAVKRDYENAKAQNDQAYARMKQAYRAESAANDAAQQAKEALQKATSAATMGAFGRFAGITAKQGMTIKQAYQARISGSELSFAQTQTLGQFGLMTREEQRSRQAELGRKQLAGLGIGAGALQSGIGENVSGFKDRVTVTSQRVQEAKEMADRAEDSYAKLNNEYSNMADSYRKSSEVFRNTMTLIVDNMSYLTGDMETLRGRIAELRQARAS